MPGGLERSFARHSLNPHQPVVATSAVKTVTSFFNSGTSVFISVILRIALIVDQFAESPSTLDTGFVYTNDTCRADSWPGNFGGAATAGAAAAADAYMALATIGLAPPLAVIGIISGVG